MRSIDRCDASGAPQDARCRTGAIVILLLPFALMTGGMAAGPAAASPQSAGAVLAAQVADLQLIKRRLVRASVMGELDPASGAYRHFVDKLDRQVSERLAEDPGWWTAYTDVNDPAISYAAQAWVIPQQLAKAFACPHSRYHRDARLRESIVRGLTHLSRFAYPGCEQVNNWWAWRVGLPMHLLPILRVMEGELPASLFDQQVATLGYVLGVGDELAVEEIFEAPSTWPQGKTDTNNLWDYRLKFHLGVLVENPAMAGRWWARAVGELAPPGEGCWQRDFSYKFHGPSPMWAYGEAFIWDYAGLIEHGRGTAFEVPKPHLERFALMTERFVNGFLYRGRMCPAMIGRSITRADAYYFTQFGPPGVLALAALARSGDPWRERFTPLIVRERRHFGDDAYWSAALAAASRDLPDVRPAPPTRDICAYPDSDFLQVTRPTWAVGIKMHSNRNWAFESINGENLQGWFLSHGSMFHFLEGTEWDGCWPTLDWTRLPGTTVAENVRAYNESPFTGVLRSSAEIGLAAMELRVDGFQARKSWFVDGERIVCQGSAVRGPGRVETAVFNRPVAPRSMLATDQGELPREACDEVMTVNWAWIQDVGYVFARPTRIRLIRTTRTSDWTSVREARRHGAGEKVTQEYLVGVIPHDAEHRGYQYVMTPGVQACQMNAIAAEVRVRYQFQADDDVHLVTTADDAASRVRSMVFWEPGEQQNVRVDRPGMLLECDGTWQVIDPAWSDEPITIEAAGSSWTVTPKVGRPIALRMPAASTPSP